MSLPDTIFIFLLALIIFGPKKLPEMAKQLGRLMGEFRRASNDFKFQIEEELRQADIANRQEISSIDPGIQPPSSPSSPPTRRPAPAGGCRSGRFAGSAPGPTRSTSGTGR